MSPSATWSPGFKIPSFARLPYGGGLGDVEKAQYTKLATSAAGTAVTAASTPALALIGPLAATGIGLALVGVGIALNMWFTRKGPQQKIDATKYADGAEPILRDNVNLYLEQPIRTVSMRAGALANFDQTWGRLVELCGDPKLGDAGKRCISERQKGGAAPWCNKPGHLGCDWFVYYRDPIANDPDVKPDSALLGLPSQSSGGPIGGGGFQLMPAAVDGPSNVGLWVGVALIVGVLGYAAVGD